MQGIGFANEPPAESRDDERTRQKIRYKVVHGEMDDKEIEFDVSAQVGVDMTAFLCIPKTILLTAF